MIFAALVAAAASAGLAKGLACAHELATNHRARSRALVEGLNPPARLDLEALAKREGHSPITMRTWIKRARKYYAAAARKRARLARPAHPCDEQGCKSELPRGAHGNRRYCDEHRAGAARVRRLRAARES